MSREAMQMALEALTWDLGSAAQIDKEADAIAALRAALAEQPEPGSLAELRDMLQAEVDRLIAAKPARVPLTDAEIDALWQAPMSADWEHREFARAIERAHGITGEQE